MELHPVDPKESYNDYIELPTQSLVFCVMFCRSLFVLLYFYFSPLCCLFFFDLRILIPSLVSSISSYLKHELLLFFVILWPLSYVGAILIKSALPLRLFYTIIFIMIAISAQKIIPKISNSIELSFGTRNKVNTITTH